MRRASRDTLPWGNIMNENELEELNKVENLIDLLRFKVIDVLNDKCELRYEVSARRAQIDTFVKTNRKLQAECDTLHAETQALRNKIAELSIENDELKRLNKIF